MTWDKWDLQQTKMLLLDALVAKKEEEEKCQALYNALLREEEQGKELQSQLAAQDDQIAKMKTYIAKLEAELADLKKGGLNND